MISNKDMTPPPNSDIKNCEDRRLWIGNLDPRINEYQLLKLLQKHGTIEKFDLLFHRSGPLVGQPRGYAFVTYSSKDEATLAKQILHNILVGNRKINVTWAHSVNNEEPEKRKPTLDIPALAGTKNVKKASRETQIQAIEAKLKLMAGSTMDELEINKTLATEAPVIVQYQSKQNGETTGHNNSSVSRHKYNNRRHQVRPYNKHRRR